MAYSDLISSFYNMMFNEKDERIKDWPLFGSPVPAFLLILAYFSFVFLGPRWMANRQPVQIGPVMTAYNIFMVFYCAFFSYELIMSSYETNFTLSCNWTVDYSNSPGAMRMASASWFGFVGKLIELLDTINFMFGKDIGRGSSSLNPDEVLSVLASRPDLRCLNKILYFGVFYILRKKNSLVTFSHVFHHGCPPMFYWWGIHAGSGGHGSFHGTLNGCVHVVGYLYYFIASLGPKYQKYLWWKRYLIVCQLAQFFIVTLHNSQYLFYDCAYPVKYVCVIQGFITIFAGFLLTVQVKHYRKSKTNSEKQATLTMNDYIKTALESSHGHATSMAGDVSTTDHNLRQRKLVLE